MVERQVVGTTEPMASWGLERDSDFWVVCQETSWFRCVVVVEFITSAYQYPVGIKVIPNFPGSAEHLYGMGLAFTLN